MGLFGRIRRDERNFTGGGKAYRIVNSVGLILIFLAAGILVFNLTGLLPLNSYIVGFVATVGVIAFGLLSTGAWIKKLENHEYKKLSITFICLLSAMCLLWIICIWVVVIAMHTEISEQTLYGILNFIKYTFIASLQFFVASFIATSVTKFKKTMLAFQIIAYIAYVFFDGYITFAAICLSITSEGTEFLPMISILWQQPLITFFVLSLVYVLIANAVMQRAFVRKRIDVDEKLDRLDRALDEQTKEVPVEEKLAKLKDLKDKGVITEEEYNKKREDILSKM